MYCGDETGAFVGDVSSYSSCFGYGGEDCPKSVLASYMYRDGTIPTSLHRVPPSSSRMQGTTLKTADTTAAVSAATAATSKSQTFEQNLKIQNPPSLSSFQEEDDVVPIFSPYPTGKDALNPDSYLENDGLIQNYDAYENVWLKAFHDLNVRHLGKHYGGYGNGVNNDKNGISGGRVKVRRLHQVSSSTIKKEQYDDSLDVDNQSLIHPLLAIDSGHTAYNHNTHGSDVDLNNSKISTSVKNKQRSKILEILFESLSAPAAFVAPSPMLSSFAFGRQTSLIVDIGARGMRVTPIVDGLLLENAQRRSGRGGEWLNSIQNHVINEYMERRRKRNKKDENDNFKNSIFSNSHGFVHPRYACHTRKDEISVNYPTTNIQKSIFHDLAVRDVMYEMKTSPHIIGVDTYRDEDWTAPFDHMNSESANKEQKSTTKLEAMDIDGTDQTGGSSESNDKNDNNNYDSDDDPNGDYEDNSKKMYILPDGTKINLEKTQTGKDLCRLPELFFSPEIPFSEPCTMTSEKQSQPTFSSLPIHELIKSSLSAVADVDVRKELCGNIILTGASSLFPNMEQRLSLEISYLVPNMYRCKVICSRNTLERRFSPWVGGSVLTSLGSFQQLWLGKTEYDEYGAMLATQRFP